jgi:hypothetical protein
MTITCFIEYKINAYKLAEFEQYAKNWGEIIPRCGGDLLGYFLPHEGSNDTAYGLISFDSLKDYEKYRARLKTDEAGKDNFIFAQKEQFITGEKRSFLKVVENTYKKPPEQLV